MPPFQKIILVILGLAFIMIGWIFRYEYTPITISPANWGPKTKFEIIIRTNRFTGRGSCLFYGGDQDEGTVWDNSWLDYCQ